MELSKEELFALLILLEKEEHAQGLSEIESNLVNKLQVKYKELGGYIREV